MSSDPRPLANSQLPLGSFDALAKESDENAKRSTEVLTGLALLFVTFVIAVVVFRLWVMLRPVVL